MVCLARASWSTRPTISNDFEKARPRFLQDLGKGEGFKCHKPARGVRLHTSRSQHDLPPLPSGESVVSVSRLTETCVSHQDSGAVSRGCRLGPFDLIGAFFSFFFGIALFKTASHHFRSTMSTRKEREKEEENERRAEEKIAKKAELVAKRAARDAEKAVKLATRVDEVVEQVAELENGDDTNEWTADESEALVLGLIANPRGAHATEQVRWETISHSPGLEIKNQDPLVCVAHYKLLLHKLFAAKVRILFHKSQDCLPI